ncbi:ImmA/IrrE family metallo-endopeptidase [Bacillus sp. NPDC077027]|uniref:ImmA/IrrE family metallo-endopeptidase n=1 Tax=Bacillus sp. NPDC077027 TaxID=3390548 RepID=UPI003D0243EC
MTRFLTHLEEDIKRLYTRLQLDGPAYMNMHKIATELNIWIHYEETGSMMIKHQGVYSIVLNRYASSEEQWEDFAHELCHVLKHTGNHFEMNKQFRDLQEFQAKQFMYHFCVPTYQLLQMKLPYLRQQAVQNIAQRFHVTLAFAEKRLTLFEQRKIGIQFQQKLALYFSRKQCKTADKVAEKEAVYQTMREEREADTYS